MAKRAYDKTPLTHAETRMCRHLTTVCTVQKDKAVHWCDECERFSDETPCHRCNPCTECVRLEAEWQERRRANPPIGDDGWEQMTFEFVRAA
jgi:hypothetical protein